MPGYTSLLQLPYLLDTEGLWTIGNVTRLLAERLDSILNSVAGTNPPFEGVSLSAPQAIPHNVLTQVAFDTRFETIAGQPVLLQPDGTMRIVTPGVYLAHGYATFAANTTGLRGVHFARTRAGATTYLESVSANATADGSTLMQINMVKGFNAGDILHLRVRQRSGAALNLNGVAGLSDGTCKLVVQWLRAL